MIETILTIIISGGLIGSFGWWLIYLRNAK